METGTKKQSEVVRTHEIRLLKGKAKWKKYWKRLRSKRIRTVVKKDISGTI